MIVMPDQDTIMMDVDDTLVMWDNDGKYAGPEWDAERINIDGLGLIPHYEHIRLLKYHKARGRTIVVWSAGGSVWARDVVKALKLEGFVDLIVNKPRWFYDDQPTHYGIGTPKYCAPPEEPKKDVQDAPNPPTKCNKCGKGGIIAYAGTKYAKTACECEGAFWWR